MNIQQIMEHLPHRYPMLLVDRLVSVDHEEGVAWGLKQLSQNEWFFQGHLPDAPQMPVGLLLEAMGQVGAAAILAMPQNQGLYLFLAGMDNVHIHGPIPPGHCLRIRAQRLRYRGNSGKTRVTCHLDDHEEVVAEAEYSYVLGPPDGAPPEE